MISGCIFDVDGVLTFQGKTYPGAQETVNALREKMKVRFVTNSTLKSRMSCAERLQREGFLIQKEEVITASYATAVYLKEVRAQSCWILLKREGLSEFKGIIHDDKTPEYVVVGDFREDFNFENLNKALRLLLKGARLVGMSPERVDSSLGEVELNVGAWAHMLEAASGVRCVYIGKPNAYMFELALTSMGLRAFEVVMVGDRVDSDVMGAQALGIKTILVKTGEFSERDMEKGQPDFICNSIAEVRDVVEIL